MRPNKPLWFEKMWLEDEGCHDIVASAWREGEGSSPMGRVVTKVDKCQTKLKWWSERNFGNITWEIAEKKRMLKAAEKNELASLMVKVEQM